METIKREAKRKRKKHRGNYTEKGGKEGEIDREEWSGWLWN